MVKANSCVFKMKRNADRWWMMDSMTWLQTSVCITNPAPLNSKWSLSRSADRNSCSTATSAGGGKNGTIEFRWLSQNPRGLWPLTCSSPGKRKWEKEVERGWLQSFLASSSLATSLSSWLFAVTKATDIAGAAVLTAWSWERWKGPGAGEWDS